MYSSGDNNCINLLMDKYFPHLMEAGTFTMSEAELSLKQLLKKINDKEEEVCNILNLS
jgi:hypothetical protein